MKMARRLAICTLLALFPLTGLALGQDAPVPGMDDWMTLTEHQGTIEPGTTITMENWQQYKQFMPLGMIGLFEGKWFWKMPPDIQMQVRKTIVYPLPKGYQEASEKYGNQTRVVHLPNGHYYIANYVAGLPFPHPSGPDKGYEILANVWFAYVPHLYVNTTSDMASSCTQDHFHNIACTKLIFVYRQEGYNTDPGIPVNDPRAGDAWFTEWLMVEEPEQSKYLSNLILFYKNPESPQDSYVFVPALRRSLRLSVTARCAPVVGSDFVQDDYKTTGFNGGLALFGAKYLGSRKILQVAADYANVTGDYPNNYYMPLGFPTPAWGKWELRDVNIIDARRIPSERPGYCYGSRIMYVDNAFWYAIWAEIYDSNMKLWKVFMGPGAHVVNVPQEGRVVTNSYSGCGLDIQNDHETCFSSMDKQGHDAVFNSDAPKQYHDFSKYCTPGGLMQIMQ
jgi:hypothetical protein